MPVTHSSAPFCLSRSQLFPSKGSRLPQPTRIVPSFLQYTKLVKPFLTLKVLSNLFSEVLLFVPQPLIWYVNNPIAAKVSRNDCHESLPRTPDCRIDLKNAKPP
ncbi:hypothetical protein CEXT_235321 [Caerostris extrusa]|uniref:Uncharacterized protein n=1 Tax=Caerostris extrusa TaxID=172846 RepID=A0AAV4Y9D0_CAEEX|nr:hypothetical protein CEXT_235321 [Caerostris extrusa]